MFTNAKKVMIGNKEVESIVTSNGGILYERPIPDNYALDLVSDVNSISSANNESATLTATLTNNNNPVSGKNVLFISPPNSGSISRSISANTETPVGSSYSFTVPSGGEYEGNIYLDSAHKVRIACSYGDGAILKINGVDKTGDFAISTVSVADGIVTCAGGNFDCSAYDLCVFYSSRSLTITDYGGFYSNKTTDANGVATATYVPINTTGTKTITASSMGVSDTVQINVT